MVAAHMFPSQLAQRLTDSGTWEQGTCRCIPLDNDDADVTSMVAVLKWIQMEYAFQKKYFDTSNTSISQFFYLFVTTIF
jgi:hypothetical protein